MLFHQSVPNASQASRQSGGDRGGKLPWGCSHQALGGGGAIPRSNSSCGYGGAAHSASNGSSWLHSTPYWAGLGWPRGARSAFAHAYEVAMGDGTTLECIRREEPKLLLGDDGEPEALITQCTVAPMGQSPAGPDGPRLGAQWSTVLVVQPTNTDHRGP